MRRRGGEVKSRLFSTEVKEYVFYDRVVIAVNEEG